MEPLSGSHRCVSDALTNLLLGEGDGVLFDGAGFGRDAIFGICPRKVIEGTWDDWAIIEDHLTKGGSGGLAGWFDYEGNFRFGEFPSWEIAHDEFPYGRLPARKPDFRAGMTRTDWIRRTGQAKEYIAAGDIYQVNLTHTLSSPWRGNAGPLYPRLRSTSPAPFSCFLRLGDTTVLSTSPECFLKVNGRRIVTRPIKGTRPRNADPGEDSAAARELLASAKERAELTMITDLERNDLGQVCKYGTVEVTSLCSLESFAHVHHLVSTVEGELRPGISAWEALRACYPGGSITGAPKKRAREIIAELESSPRGIYTGAIGFFGRDGRAVFNIAIRTLVVRDGVATFGVGAGIVADSDPGAEYEETMQKAAGLFAALGA